MKTRMPLYCLFLVWITALDCASSEKDIILSINVNNQDAQYFGYEETEEGEGPAIGPTSLLIDSTFAYIVDHFHGNIKRIDLKTSEIVYSSKFWKDHNPHLRDIAIFNNLVYVTSDLDSLYIFTKDLLYIKSLFIVENSEYKYFIKITSDKLFLNYNYQEHISIDLTNAIERTQISYFRNFYKYPHGKQFKYYVHEGTYHIITDFGDKLIGTEYTKNSIYDAINLDYDSEKFCFFQISKSKLILVCDYFKN
jgi:hypothetical protein